MKTEYENKTLQKTYNSMTKKELFAIAFSFAQRLEGEETKIAIKGMKIELKTLKTNRLI